VGDKEVRIWGIHTQDEALFLKGDKIAIGWKQIGNLQEIPPTRDDFKEKYRVNAKSWGFSRVSA